MKYIITHTKTTHTSRFNIASNIIIKNTLINFMDTDEDVKDEFGDIHFYSNTKMKEKIIKTINNKRAENQRPNFLCYFFFPSFHINL
jgi:hypothetical protein